MRKALITLFILISFVAAAAQQGTAPASLPSVTLPAELDSSAAGLRNGVGGERRGAAGETLR
jgi:hypothetical protein